MLCWKLSVLAALGAAGLVISPAWACGEHASGNPAPTCVEHEPRQMVEFTEGSAELHPDQVLMLDKMFKDSGHSTAPSQYRISIRAYADRKGEFEFATWSAADLELADARARALAQAAKMSSGMACVERVAMGVAPSDAPPPRIGLDGRRWYSRELWC